MTFAIIAVMLAIFWLGLTIRDELRELQETLETEVGAIVTELERIADALEWSNDNPRERE